MNKLVLNSMVVYMIIIKIEKLELPNRKHLQIHDELSWGSVT